jgi:hypothetical protein
VSDYDAWAGRLRQPHFDWADATQELKSDDIEQLTESFLDSATFNAVRTRVREGFVPSRQLDWGSWAVPATKDDILAHMARWQPGWDLPEPGDETHKPRLQRARCLQAVEALPADGEYVLVIQES